MNERAPDGLEGLRPARVCGALLAALDAAEGRRRQRKRDQTPDAIGLKAKRELLERVVSADPPPAAFEAFLLECAGAPALTGDAGTKAAMARAIYDEWTLAHAMGDFAAWLEHGAPSEDAAAGSPRSQR